MSDIWLLEPAFETYMRFGTYAGEDNAIDVTHFLVTTIESNDIAIGIDGSYLEPGLRSSAELILRLEDFDVDYFQWGGYAFASERMRQALALDPSEILYFDVDDSQSAPLPRSKAYKMMLPLVYEDILDTKQSVYWFNELPEADRMWPDDIYKLVLRQDAAPKHDLFYDKFFAMFLLCSDQLAARLLEAGCTGLEFTDPRGYRCADVQRRRTLHGIETYGEKADPEEYRAAFSAIDVYNKNVDPTLLQSIFGDKDKIDWVISRLKS